MAVNAGMFFLAGDYESAVDTLKMAITLIKQSVTANSESSRVSSSPSSDGSLLVLHILEIGIHCRHSFSPCKIAFRALSDWLTSKLPVLCMQYHKSAKFSWLNILT